MRILVLGGTQFYGRAIVDTALERGHEVTVFNRGLTDPTAFGPEVEQLRGDRDGGLDALGDRAWDRCIDVSGYLPRLVRDSARRLSDRVEHYTFVSSVSVFGTPQQQGLDEEGPKASLVDPTVEQIDGDTYGGLKVLCEQAVESEMPGRGLMIRPGLIVGPGDHTGRFTYWPVRLAAPGPVLGPGDPDQPVQVIDVRDLATWTLAMSEQAAAGAFNAVGPQQPLRMREFLETIAVAVGGDPAAIVWTDDRFLAENGVEPWVGLPLWLLDGRGMLAVDVSKAVAHGLTFRPLAETALDTLAWARSPAAKPGWPGVGLERAREAQLLALWSARTEGT
jgi:2'-hydroxyisoflavone reductase